MLKLKRATSIWLAALAAFGLSATLAGASTIVSGNVSGTWTKNGSPYIVTGNVTVPSGQTLTLQPGATVIIGQSLRVDVLGSISAVGTAANRITIRGANASLYWDTIAVNYGSGASRFSNCTISDATNALYLNCSENAAMEIPILNCVFTNCQGSCISGLSHGWLWADQGGVHTYYPILSPKIQNCRFGTSSNGCVFVVDGTRYVNGSPPTAYYGRGTVNPQIINCDFVSLSGSAVSLSDGAYAAASYPNIENNVFVQCAIAVQKSSLTIFNDTLVFNCFFNNQVNFLGYPAGVYGTICCVNSSGTPCDVVNNIFVDPRFTETVNYTLAPNSPCIDAGNPDSAYFDTDFPPSQGTIVNDQGSYGGPLAVGWLVVNQAPTIQTIANTSVNELTPLTVAVTANDPDAGQTLTYSLGGNIPSGVGIDAMTGVVSWTPTEAQGPSTNTITVIATDNGTPAKSATNTFSVVVNEVNTAPVLIVPGPQSVYATTTLSVTNSASDDDLPANSLTFGLASAPSGVSINPTTGLLTWTPTSGQVGTNTIWVKVVDNNPWAVNSQQLSTTNSFTVVVNGLTPPSFLDTPFSQVVQCGRGAAFCAQATGYPRPTYQWRFNGVSIPDATGTCYSMPSTSITNIGTYDVVIANSAGTNISSVVTLSFADLKMLASVYLTGPVGQSYRIEAAPALSSTNWAPVTNITITTQPFIYVDYTSGTNRMQFYRAVPQ